MNLKPCSFCGSDKIKLLDKDETISEYCKYKYLIIVCDNCKATSGEYYIKFFNEFSKYTVQDFRENNALRSREEDSYELYINKEKIELSEKWNKRV